MNVSASWTRLFSINIAHVVDDAFCIFIKSTFTLKAQQLWFNFIFHLKKDHRTGICTCFYDVCVCGGSSCTRFLRIFLMKLNPECILSPRTLLLWDCSRCTPSNKPKMAWHFYYFKANTTFRNPVDFSNHSITYNSIIIRPIAMSRLPIYLSRCRLHEKWRQKSILHFIASSSCSIKSCKISLSYPEYHNHSHIPIDVNTQVRNYASLPRMYFICGIHSGRNISVNIKTCWFICAYTIFGYPCCRNPPFLPQSHIR